SAGTCQSISTDESSRVSAGGALSAAAPSAGAWPASVPAAAAEPSSDLAGSAAPASCLASSAFAGFLFEEAAHPDSPRRVATLKSNVLQKRVLRMRLVA